MSGGRGGVRTLPLHGDGPSMIHHLSTSTSHRVASDVIVRCFSRPELCGEGGECGGGAGFAPPAGGG